MTSAFSGSTHYLPLNLIQVILNSQSFVVYFFLLLLFFFFLILAFIYRIILMVLYMVITVSTLMKFEVAYNTCLSNLLKHFFMHVGFTYPLRSPRGLNLY